MDDPWKNLRPFTQARIGMKRSGHACSTVELLKFQRAHAMARDAVLKVWDVEALAGDLRSTGATVLTATSQVSDRAQFLKRPDLGRKLNQMDSGSFTHELSFIISDGLSAKAIDTHLLPFWKVLSAALTDAGFDLPPLVLVPFGRVAISDEIGAQLKSKLSVIFIGERPGLTSTDSLGIYLTYEPTLGKNDAQRNCISNVRPPEGLSYESASHKLIHLIRESLRLKLSGVELKEPEEVLNQPANNASQVRTVVKTL